jgi:hypothetical protein
MPHIIKIDLLLLLLLLRGQNPLSYYILYNNESKQNIRAFVCKANKKKTFEFLECEDP